MQFIKRGRKSSASDFGLYALISDLIRLAQLKPDRGILELLTDLSLMHLLGSATSSYYKELNQKQITRNASISYFGKRLDVERRCNQSDLFVFCEVLLRGSYDKLFELAGDNIATWVDIGAHIGLTSLLANIRWPGLSGVCVEPVTETATILHRNMQRNNSGLSIEINAIDTCNGRAALYKTGWWSSSTTVASVRDKRLCNPNRPEYTHRLADEIVQTTTMSSLFDKYNLDTVDIVKFDAEGAEQTVFTENPIWLKRVKLIALDLHERYIDGNGVMRALQQAGFECISREGNNYILRHKRFKL